MRTASLSAPVSQKHDHSLRAILMGSLLLVALGIALFSSSHPSGYSMATREFAQEGSDAKQLQMDFAQVCRSQLERKLRSTHNSGSKDAMLNAFPNALVTGDFGKKDRRAPVVKKSFLKDGNVIIVMSDGTIVKMSVSPLCQVREVIAPKRDGSMHPLVSADVTCGFLKFPMMECKRNEFTCYQHLRPDGSCYISWFTHKCDYHVGDCTADRDFPSEWTTVRGNIGQCRNGQDWPNGVSCFDLAEKGRNCPLDGKSTAVCSPMTYQDITATFSYTAPGVNYGLAALDLAGSVLGKFGTPFKIASGVLGLVGDDGTSTAIKNAFNDIITIIEESMGTVLECIKNSGEQSNARSVEEAIQTVLGNLVGKIEDITEETDPDPAVTRNAAWRINYIYTSGDTPRSLCKQVSSQYGAYSTNSDYEYPSMETFLSWAHQTSEMCMFTYLAEIMDIKANNPSTSVSYEQGEYDDVMTRMAQATTIFINELESRYLSTDVCDYFEYQRELVAERIAALRKEVERPIVEMLLSVLGEDLGRCKNQVGLKPDLSNGAKLSNDQMPAPLTTNPYSVSSAEECEAACLRSSMCTCYIFDSSSQCELRKGCLLKSDTSHNVGSKSTWVPNTNGVGGYCGTTAYGELQMTGCYLKKFYTLTGTKLDVVNAMTAKDCALTCQGESGCTCYQFDSSTSECVLMSGCLADAEGLSPNGQYESGFCLSDLYTKANYEGSPSSVLSCSQNVALHHAASQSSTRNNAGASRAVDGNIETDLTWDPTVSSYTFCTTTNQDTNAWFFVDLGAVYTVCSIRVYPRDNSLAIGRIGNFDLFVSTTQPSATDLTTGWSSYSKHICHYQSAVLDGPTTMTCSSDIQGRYVGLRLRGRNYLTICEFEVLRKNSWCQWTNIALGKPAVQSSTASVAVAGRAVDGNADRAFPNYQSTSCTHTGRDYRAFWYVDLGSEENVCRVRMTPRDISSTLNRLRNFNVFVTNTPPTSGTLVSTSDVCLHYDWTAVEPFTVACAKRGRYVGVQLEGTNYLTLCEFEVFTTTDLGLEKRLALVPSPTWRDMARQFVLSDDAEFGFYDKNGAAQVRGLTLRNVHSVLGKRVVADYAGEHKASYKNGKVIVVYGDNTVVVADATDERTIRGFYIGSKGAVHPRATQLLV